MKCSGGQLQVLCGAVLLSFLFQETKVKAIATRLTASFGMAGVKSQAYLYQTGANVQVNIPIDSARWQIHELPADYSVDPKLRCKPEYVGRFLQYSGRNGDYIYNVTTASLAMHSLVFFDKDEPVACAAITPFSLPSSAVSAVFQSGVFGKIHIIQWGTGESYLAGTIKTERNLEDGIEEAMLNISILVHNRILGPYDTTLHGCNGLEGVKVLRALVTGVSYLSSATFLRQLSETIVFSSYLGHAVSVQNSSGAILGCGRFEAVFPVDASYRGKHILSQLFQYLPASLPDVSSLDIPQYNILEGIANTCSSKAAIFDPWSPPGPQLGTRITNDQFPVGDLPNHSLLVFSFVPEVPLIGNATVLGHAVNDSECNSLELTVPGSGYIVKGYAVLNGPTLTGRITFTQAVYLPDWVLGPTIVTVNLSYADLTQATSDHEWYIHEGFTDSNGNCTDHIGLLYNPYGVRTTAESGYFDDCTSQRQQRCAMGDLRGKVGTLALEPVTNSPRKTYSFYDENLHILGPFTTLGRSIVVYGTGAQSGQILGCANIEPSLVAEEEIEISFPRNGTNPEDLDRLELSHFLSTLAGVPLGDVLVNDVQAVNINGSDCLTASLWITGVDAVNASLNAGNVSALDRQNLSKYSAGPCVLPQTEGPDESQGLGNTDIIIISAVVVVFILLATITGVLLIVATRRKRKTELMFVYKVEGQQESREFSTELVKLLPSKGDQWELLGSHFKIGTKLGEGNYGQVYKGILSMVVATAPAKRYKARQTRDGKSPYTVAIKLLKGCAEERAVNNFLEEIAMMKKVSAGKCCHVVQMVGCVSTALPLALAMEFVPFGNLLSYLKYWRQKCTNEGKESLTIPRAPPSPVYNHNTPFSLKDAMDGSHLNANKDQENNAGKDKNLNPAAAKNQEGNECGGEVLCMDGSITQELPLGATMDQKLSSSPDAESDEHSTIKVEESLHKKSLPPSSGYDKLYPKEEEKVLYSAASKDLESLYSPLGEPDLRDLPSFAYQVAQGMEYLSSLGVLHRDLACRNILVDERKLLKISDFGLSRDTPEYVSSLKDKMPLRWMAPETVTMNVFTDKSDVWAFGVCLWEMYTLGDLPYRDMPLSTIVAQIVAGHRLPIPEHASSQVYQLIQCCWRSEPQARLNFTQLRYSFQSMISASNSGAGYISIQPKVSLATDTKDAPFQ